MSNIKQNAWPRTYAYVCVRLVESVLRSTRKSIKKNTIAEMYIPRNRLAKRDEEANFVSLWANILQRI